MSNAGDAEFASKVADYLDIDNVARYRAITGWLSDLDGILGPGQSYYLFLHPKTQKFTFIPWDQDQAFGQFPRATEEQRETLSIRKPWTGENQFLERVYNTHVFKRAYSARLEEFSKSVFQPECILGQVDELAGVLRPPLEEESAEGLAQMNKAAAGEKVAISMGPGLRGTS